MKKILFLILMLFAIVGVTNAQDINTTNTKNEMFYLGGTYDDGPEVVVGVSKQVYKNIWTFGNIESGNDMQLDIGAMYMFNPSDYLNIVFKYPVLNKLRLGVLGGGSIDWLNTPDNDGVETIVYAAFKYGSVISYEISEWYGVTGFYKRVVDANDENSYTPHNMYGVYGYFKF